MASVHCGHRSVRRSSTGQVTTPTTGPRMAPARDQAVAEEAAGRARQAAAARPERDRNARSHRVLLSNMGGSAGHAGPPMLRATLLIEVRDNLGIGDVGLVVPEEAGVDGLGQGLAVDGVNGGLDSLVADGDRVLGDGAG